MSENQQTHLTWVHREAVIWGEMDAFQHVNNTVYFRYFENVRIEYFETCGINALMRKTNQGPILGSTECRYLAPLTYPDNIVISTCVSEIREKRFTMRYQVYSEKMQRIVAEGSGEVVYFDYAQGKTCVIPKTIVENIRQVEAGRDN